MSKDQNKTDDKDDEQSNPPPKKRKPRIVGDKRFQGTGVQKQKG